MNHRMTIAQICGAVESPLFDRKSARIDAKTLAIHLIAFANADGGVIAVGVEDDGTITGIDSYAENINELLRAPFDFCKPSVRVETERLSCVNRDGTPDHILLIEVLQSNDLHANQADEVFFRVGDKSKKLNFEERLQLMYAKGTRYFEDTPVPDATVDDIDLDFVRTYTQKLGYRKSPEEYLRENKEFISTKGGKEEISAAAMLLFGKNPMHYFPRARIRFVRYEGTEAKVGAEMNVIKDMVFEGRILQVIEKALEFVRSQIKERTYLGADTRFVTEPEYPEFAWKELIVNAVAHRDYSIKGTDIQIKMFDDRLTVRPAFREPFLLLSPPDSPYSEEVETSSLNVAEELLVTWDPEFIRWHDRWFGAGARPLLYADTLQAADFLPPTEGRWVAAPAIAAASRIGKSAKVCRFTSPPPDRVNYLVTRAGEPLPPAAAQFLQELREHLLALGNVQVYL